jgi:hypothetical protein
VTNGMRPSCAEVDPELGNGGEDSQKLEEPAYHARMASIHTILLTTVLEQTLSLIHLLGLRQPAWTPGG